MKQDKRLGIAKLPLSDLEMETVQEVNLQLLSSLDTTKVKDKKDRGVLSIKAGPISLVLLVFSSQRLVRLSDVPFVSYVAGGVPPVHQRRGAGGPAAGEAGRGRAAEGEGRDGGRHRRRGRGKRHGVHGHQRVRHGHGRRGGRLRRWDGWHGHRRRGLRHWRVRQWTKQGRQVGRQVRRPDCHGTLQQR